MGILQREKSVLSSHVCERAAGSQLGKSKGPGRSQADDALVDEKGRGRFSAGCH